MRDLCLRMIHRRWLVLLLAAAELPLLAQIGRYPGGYPPVGYPPGQYPGRYPGGGGLPIPGRGGRQKAPPTPKDILSVQRFRKGFEEGSC